MNRIPDRRAGSSADASLADQNRRRAEELRRLRERIRHQIAADAAAAQQERQRFASELREDVKALRQRLRDEQSRAAEELRRQLSGFRDGLRRSTGTPGQEGTAGETRKAGPSSPAIPATAAAPAAPAAEDGSAAAADAPHPTDDLTRIAGIGRGVARRLAEAGIRSYAALAATDAAELRRHLGELGRLASLESWIDEARRLDGEARREDA